MPLKWIVFFLKYDDEIPLLKVATHGRTHTRGVNKKRRVVVDTKKKFPSQEASRGGIFGRFKRELESINWKIVVLKRANLSYP